MIDMEWEIGEIKQINGEWYQCLKSPDGGCKHCDMNFGGKCPIPLKECVESGRSDKSYVIFKKLEKVGEPYIRCHFPTDSKMVQKYKLHSRHVIMPDEPYIRFDISENIIEIEIKQNKENMEEKNNGNTPLNELTDKYVNGNIGYDDFEKEVKALCSCKEESKSNLKPFDLEAAKVGKPVCTRDGRKARIICFDRKGKQPIIALVAQDNVEFIENYSLNGRFNVDDTFENNNDLMMLPEKHEGWVNVYKGDNGISEYVCGDIVSNTKEEAMQYAQNDDSYITTVKIEWEE